MEIDGDGILDILSGSYSRHDKDMAGLFQVLRGNKDGTFRAPEPLKGSDGGLLIIDTTGSDDPVIGRICTRPTAVDLDGDGKLDIVSGNFGGTFAFFRGEGNGTFAPKSTWLQGDGKNLEVPNHSDPFFVDWDADGDVDLLSGSSSGGAFLFVNEGTKTEPKFGKRVTLVPTHRLDGPEMPLGDAHVKGPQSDTRIWVDDVDGDGKLDLLLGDSVNLIFAAKDVDEATARQALADHATKTKALYATLDKSKSEPGEAEMQRVGKAREALDTERAKFVAEESTGFVWLLRQK